jgi:hypothetical protein
LSEALRRRGLLKQSKSWQAARIIQVARTGKNEFGWKDRLGSNVAQHIADIELF